MPKVLLVDAEPDSRGSLQRALVGAGYEVTVVTSGSFALTVLDWDRPDVVVTQGRVGDMDGCELFSIVRSDPKTGDIPFLLLAGLEGQIAGTAAEIGVDLICTGHLSVATFVGRVGELVASRADAGGGEDPDPAPAARTQTGPRALQGSLGVMDLPGLAQAIALSGKTGRLDLSLAAGEGSIDFEAGQLVRAEFAGAVGEDAFAALVCDAQTEGAGHFGFTPGESGFTAGMPRTIHRSLERLLLSIAAGIDEGRRLPAVTAADAIADGRGAR